MRSEFIQADTLEAAESMAPWAAKVAPFDNGIQVGFWAFESLDEYQRWIDSVTSSPTDDLRESIMNEVYCADLDTLEGIAELQASIASTLGDWRGKLAGAIAAGGVSKDAVSP